VFKKILGGKKEEQAIENIRRHISVLHSAAECFKKALEGRNKNQMYCIPDLEREGDSVRREIISVIYEGAFLPFIRSSICRFVEIVDEAFDILEDAASEFEYLGPKLDKDIEQDCIKIADINMNMCDMLLIAFETLFGKGDLREKTLAIRIYEKQVDEIKFDLTRKLMKKEVKDFWEGRTLSDFISYITRISDVIEDASDYLHIINLSLR
jgi:predicted phosphate transport protein (TIGR00153 family)